MHLSDSLATTPHIFFYAFHVCISSILLPDSQATRFPTMLRRLYTKCERDLANTDAYKESMGAALARHRNMCCPIYNSASL